MLIRLAIKRSHLTIVKRRISEIITMFLALFLLWYYLSQNEYNKTYQIFIYIYIVCWLSMLLMVMCYVLVRSPLSVLGYCGKLSPPTTQDSRRLADIQPVAQVVRLSTKEYWICRWFVIVTLFCIKNQAEINLVVYTLAQSKTSIIKLSNVNETHRNKLE